MMASLTKNQKVNISKIKEGEKYKISDAIALVKECATAKFDESVDVSINLGIDTKKSDQTVRELLFFRMELVRLSVLQYLLKVIMFKRLLMQVQTLWVWTI